MFLTHIIVRKWSLHVLADGPSGLSITDIIQPGNIPLNGWLGQLSSHLALLEGRMKPGDVTPYLRDDPGQKFSPFPSLTEMYNICNHGACIFSNISTCDRYLIKIIMILE